VHEHLHCAYTRPLAPSRGTGRTPDLTFCQLFIRVRARSSSWRFFSILACADPQHRQGYRQMNHESGRRVLPPSPLRAPRLWLPLPPRLPRTRRHYGLAACYATIRLLPRAPLQ